MNHNKLNIKQNRLHFTQWSNKGYAAFCSIGKVVHIGSLAISLTQWIGNVIEHIDDILRICDEKEVKDENEDCTEEELLQLIPIVTSTPGVYGQSVIFSINNITGR